MEKVKQMLMIEALEKHKLIFPVNGYECLSDCFTIEDDLVLFWYNTEDKTTHVQIGKLSRNGAFYGRL